MFVSNTTLQSQEISNPAETSSKRLQNSQVETAVEDLFQLQNVPTDLLHYTFTLLTPREICSLSEVSKIFRGVAKQFETAPLHVDYWETLSEKYFPESVASKKIDPKENWSNFFKAQTVSKRNFLNSRFKSKKEFSHPAFGAGDNGGFQMLQDKGMLATITRSSVKIWDFEDELKPLKFELVPSGHITSAVVEDGIVCVLTQDSVLVWDLNNETSFNPEPKFRITQIPGAVKDKAKLIDGKLFVDVNLQLHLIDLKKIHKETVEFKEVAEVFDKFDLVVQRIGNTLVGIKKKKISLVFVDLNNLTVSKEFIPKDDYYFTTWAKTSYRSQLIVLKWQWQLESRYKFFKFDFADQTCVNPENEILKSKSGNPPALAYLFNNSLFVFEGSGLKGSFDTQNGQVNKPTLNGPVTSKETLDEYRYRIGKIINGVVIKKEGLMDLNTNVTYPPRNYKLETPSMYSIKDYFYEWVGSKLILGSAGKIEVLDFAE